jgi:hypothetical protein
MPLARDVDHGGNRQRSQEQDEVNHRFQDSYRMCLYTSATGSPTTFA